MKPWVFTDKNKMSSFRSGTNSAGIGAFACVGKCRSYGAQYYFSFVYTQGFISGFALIPPWAMQEYRA